MFSQFLWMIKCPQSTSQLYVRLSFRLSEIPCVRSVAPTVMDGFFPYLAHTISGMRRRVARHDLWSLPVPSRSFSHDYNRTAKIWHILLCSLYSIYNSEWVPPIVNSNDHYHNTRSTQKSPVRQQNAWFDTKMPVSTHKCPVRHKNVLSSMHQLTLPLSNIPLAVRNIFFQILFKHFVLKNP